MNRFLIITLLTLSACIKGPVFNREDLKLPAKFATSADFKTADVSVSWWDGYQDDLLNELIVLGSERNFDLAQAFLKIEEARLQTKKSIWDLYGPPITLGASYNYSQTSTARMPFIQDDKFRITDYYEAGATTNWEFDMFGASAEAIKGNRAGEIIAAAQSKDIFVSLSSEIADNYFALVTAQNKSDLNRKKINNLKALFEIARVKYETGMINKIDYLEYDNELIRAKSYQQQLIAERRGYFNALKVICGKIPAELRRRISKTRELKVYQGPLTIAEPAKWLSNRPDLIAAENQIKVQSAGVAVAIEDLLPALSFQGSFGYSAVKLSNLGTNPSEAFNVAPQITWAFLDLPRFFAEKKIASNLYEQSVINFKRAILTALKETDNALTRFGSEKKRYQFISQMLNNQYEYYKISKANYSAGRISEEKLILVENQLISSNEQQLMTHLALNQGVNFVYKAMGGGWSER